ncbi:GNAT family N-acetyltransferase, partial [Georgenia sp. 10Sc9-8]|nr:GNAT family N-acetyltransferase [Georgenia halotolerans]
RFLLKSLENRARSLGARRVLLGVNEVLEEAIALFRSAGYREVPDRLPDRYVTQVLGKDLG